MAEPNDATLGVMLENLRHLVASEEQRLASLTTRGAGLAGFAGLATAVIAAGSDDVLPLGSKILLAGAVLGLVLAGAGVVLRVMATRDGQAQELGELREYEDLASQGLPSSQIQSRTIQALLKRLAALRKSNGERADWLDRSAKLLAVAVLFAAFATVVRLFA